MREHFNSSVPHKLVFLGLALLLGLALSACATNSSGLNVGDEAPAFTLTSANDQSVSLSDYTDRQQPVLLFFHMALG